MWVKALYLKNFRIYSEAQFFFCPHVNLITGANALGKTTILEAIYLLITGRSFRTTNLKDLIKDGESGFYIELLFEKHGIEQSLKFTYSGRERAIYYNHSPCTTLASLLGLLQGTLLLPDDIQLVKGAPNLRRRYLDIQLSQMSPMYVHHLTRYYRAMKQRNALLKRRSTQAIDVFEHEMARSGAFIMQTRESTISSLISECQSVQHSLSSGKESVCLHYLSKCPSTELMNQYCKMRTRELVLGTTLVGPHKDDFSLILGNSEAKQFASEGQKKCLATALRFAEWAQLKSQSDSSPLMLIDDVGVSLDITRREKLFSLLDTFEQVFVTSTEKLNYPLSNRQVNRISINSSSFCRMV